MIILNILWFVDVLNPIGAATNQSTNEVHWIGTIFPFVLKKRNETEVAGTWVFFMFEQRFYLINS